MAKKVGAAAGVGSGEGRRGGKGLGWGPRAGGYNPAGHARLYSDHCRPVHFETSHRVAVFAETTTALSSET